MSMPKSVHENRGVQVLEIRHHGEVVARVKIRGALQGVEATAPNVIIEGRPDLVESMRDGCVITAPNVTIQGRAWLKAEWAQLRAEHEAGLD